jgi:hypothetical protein
MTIDRLLLASGWARDPVAFAEIVDWQRCLDDMLDGMGKALSASPAAEFQRVLIEEGEAIAIAGEGRTFAVIGRDFYDRLLEHPAIPEELGARSFRLKPGPIAAPVPLKQNRAARRAAAKRNR